MSVETAAVKDGTEGADPSLQAEIDTLLCMMESHREWVVWFTELGGPALLGNPRVVLRRGGDSRW